MLKLLSRRWLGVACWVYLLSLMLAAFLFWMLPGSPVVHAWNFDGTIRFEGFTCDHQHLVVTNMRPDRTVFHQLRIDTGECTTYLPLQHPDKELDYQSLMKKASSLRLSHFEGDESKSGLILQRADGTKRTILINTERLNVEPFNSPSRGAFIITVPATTFGNSVISDNERWLIVTRQYAEFWQSLIPWLRKTLSWSPDFLSEGWRYSAAIIDLNTNQEIACPLWTHDQPTYSIHPEGLGFAVLDQKAIGAAAPMQMPNYASTITWYTLPLSPAHHSFQQWYLILGACALPIAVSLFLALARRQRQDKAPAITVEAPLSKN